MIHTNQRIIKHKVGLLNLAKELGNISHACKTMGDMARVFRTLFYAAPANFCSYLSGAR